jgi:hypothetical protein
MSQMNFFTSWSAEVERSEGLCSAVAQQNPNDSTPNSISVAHSNATLIELYKSMLAVQEQSCKRQERILEETYKNQEIILEQSLKRMERCLKESLKRIEDSLTQNMDTEECPDTGEESTTVHNASRAPQKSEPRNILIIQTQKNCPKLVNYVRCPDFASFQVDLSDDPMSPNMDLELAHIQERFAGHNISVLVIAVSYSGFRFCDKYENWKPKIEVLKKMFPDAVYSIIALRYHASRNPVPNLDFSPEINDSRFMGPVKQITFSMNQQNLSGQANKQVVGEITAQISNRFPSKRWKFPNIFK